MDPQIPDKLYFKIGEVAELTGVKPHVLRYWETEIGSIRPVKNRQQQRVYRRRDIELILRLKELLYTQGYTIAGARKLLRRKPDDAAVAVAPPPPVPPATSATPETAAGETGQLFLPLSSGFDRRLLDELRRDLVRLRNSLFAVS
jgi:DNA-binding transcriptional MerR regulator